MLFRVEEGKNFVDVLIGTEVLRLLGLMCNTGEPSSLYRLKYNLLPRTAFVLTFQLSSFDYAQPSCYRHTVDLKPWLNYQNLSGRIVVRQERWKSSSHGGCEAADGVQGPGC